MENALLRRKLEAIRPSNSQTELGPGRVCVAILKPDSLPEDDIDGSEVFWAKCPGSKTVATLLNAFKTTDSREIGLIQGHQVLKSSQLVSSLTATNKLCVLEAVLAGELQLRLPQQAPTTTNTPVKSTPTPAKAPTPLRNITYNAINRPAASISASQTLNAKQPPARSNVVAASPSDWSASPSPVEANHRLTPALVGNDPSREPLFLGWANFVFERRECMSRAKGGELNCRLDQIDHAIIKEWEGLQPAQRQYFVDRMQQFPFRGSSSHRAFWMYYYDMLASELQQGRDPHGSFDGLKDFFEHHHTAWSRFNYKNTFKYEQRVVAQRTALGVPQLPACTSGAQQPSVARSPSQSDSPASVRKGASRSTPIVLDDAEDFAASLQREEPASSSRIHITDLFDHKPVEQLEAGVAEGVKILKSIRSKLEAETSEESEHWLSAISKVEANAARTKTIVGVVGATGAGKSSVINAILDQERLVPTNCMRACTAVVTEISYNHEEIPYRAEIEFIDKQDWLKELKTSFEDLFDGSGKVSREATNEDSEAGIAYAKIKAVYPLMSKENMENATIEQLMQHKNVKNLLGGSRSIEDEDSSTFYKKLQLYVDSKEKTFSREKKTEAEKQRAREMEFWPLIRVVRLYVKAPALATGAILVDLPGVHDSNQARAAVAQGYLKQCTGLWIVAPITRAVDDKSAKTLLGDTFKRQLKMDGGYNSVTFICSKTDDISLTEAQDSLGLDEEVAPMYARSEELRKKSDGLKSQLEQLKDLISDMRAATDAADVELEVWEKLNDQLEEGQTVYAPREKSESNKRKRDESDSGSRKKSKYAELSDGDDFIVDDDEDFTLSDAEGTPEVENRGEPLTAEAISDKIAELKASKKEGRRERADITQSMKELREQIAEVAKERNDIDGELSNKCIRGRNEYSRGAIQQDFASGIRELDQEIAEEEDAANFNPEDDARDYDEVAKSLPVFCVSSRGYQKLMGRLQKDRGLASFRNVEETEVPALQLHCQSLTIKNREASCKRFLNGLSQLLNSLRLWSSSDGSGAKLTDAQQKREDELLRGKLNKLDAALERTVSNVCTAITNEVQENLYDRFPDAVEAAKNDAITIQGKWGAPVDRGNRTAGGLYWATYKATVRRDGTYRDNHFNDDLIEPLIKQVTPGWEKAFSRRLPITLSNLANDIHKILTTFHDDVEKRAMTNGSNIARFQLLRHSLSVYKEIAKDAGREATEFINARQKDINREFVPVIMEAMMPAYATTTAEHGPGSYMRMKNTMREHVGFVKHIMFDASVQHIKRSIDKMVKEAEDLMLTKLDEVFVAAKRDYESVIVGKSQNATQSTTLPKEQRRIRHEVLTVVDSVDLRMKRLVGLEPPEAIEDEEQSDSVTKQDGDIEEEADARSLDDEPAESIEEKIKVHGGTTDVKMEDEDQADQSANNSLHTDQDGPGFGDEEEQKQSNYSVKEEFMDD